MATNEQIVEELLKKTPDQINDVWEKWGGNPVGKDTDADFVEKNAESMILITYEVPVGRARLGRAKLVRILGLKTDAEIQRLREETMLKVANSTKWAAIVAAIVAAVTASAVVVQAWISLAR